MGVPLKFVQVPEGMLLVNRVDGKIWGFRPEAPQFEGAYAVGNLYEEGSD